MTPDDMPLLVVAVLTGSAAFSLAVELARWAWGYPKRRMKRYVIRERQRGAWWL